MIFDVFNYYGGAQGAPNIGPQDAQEIIFALVVFIFGVSAFLCSILVPYFLVVYLHGAL